MASVTSGSSSSTLNGDHLEVYKQLFYHIRSADEEERRRTIVRIPNLILDYVRHSDQLVKQILLLIYNLNTNGDIQENLTLGNMSTIFRHLLRLYTDTVQTEHHHDQIDALVHMVDHSDTPELVIELIHVLYQCSKANPSKEDAKSIDDAFNTIRERAAVNMHPEVLLMIHTIMARR